MAEGAATDRPTGQQARRRPSRKRYWKQNFLDALAAGATVAEACVDSGCPKSTAYLNRNRDPDFAREWDDAHSAGTALIEREIRRRAVEGWLEPHFYEGQVAGYVRRYDSRLLLRLAERRDAAWRQGQTVKLEGKVEHRHVIVLPCNGRDLVHQLGQCPVCDQARAEAIEHQPAEAAPLPALAPPEPAPLPKAATPARPAPLPRTGQRVP